MGYLIAFVAGGAAEWAFAKYVWPKLGGHI